MHLIQKKLLGIIPNNKDIGNLSLRKIAELVGVDGKPQIIKHHLTQLEKAGLIQLNLKSNILKLVVQGKNQLSSSLYSLPIMGSANCGPANICAEQNIEKYLKISSSMLQRNKKGLFALVADGDSMNKAEINGQTIENGDFILINNEIKFYKNNDIVVAIIDGMATIKRYIKDTKNNRIVLSADSTEDYMSIYIEEGDNFLLNGKVVGIIKKHN